MVAEVDTLVRAGADFAAIASNTPHIVFDEIQRRVPIPMISIVEAAAEAAAARGLTRLSLFGARFTMQGRAYPRVFARAGMELVMTGEEEQSYIHDKYVSELVNAVFLPETREGLLRIVRRMVAGDAIDGLILGGTELPLILRDGRCAGPAPRYDGNPRGENCWRAALSRNVSRGGRHGERRLACSRRRKPPAW